MAAQKKVDYERIEPGWRAGLKSPAELAADYTAETDVTVSRAAIIKHFEKMGVPRDLGAKIKAKADAMVAASMVAGKVSTATIAKEREIVDAGAMAAATVQINQRQDIHRARTLCMSLLQELEAQTAGLPGLQEIGEILRCPSETGQDKLNDLYRAVISLPERTKTMKAWTESFKALVTMEREAYGIAAAPEKPPEDKPASDPMDIARRVAFLLQAGLMAKKDPT